MKKTIKLLFLCTFVLLFLVFTSYCEPNNEIKTIDVIHTSEHKKFFDVPVEIAPPDIYNFIKIPSGIADKKKHIAFEAWEIDLSMKMIVDGLLNGTLTKSKTEVKSISSFMWNRHCAVLVKLFQDKNKSKIGKWMLAIEKDKESCYVICGSYAAKNDKMSQTVLDVIKTAYVRADKPLYRAALTVTANTNGLPFRAACFRQDALIYTKDGKLPTEAFDGAMFVISRRKVFVPRENRVAFAKNAIEDIDQTPYFKVLSTSEGVVENYPAITITGVGKDKEGIIFQTVLFEQGHATFLVGISKKNGVENLEMFKKLSSNLNIKK